MLENVTYRYCEDAEPAVRELNISAQKDRITALVGQSGSGKTTICNLIARFYDATEGRITLGGIDIQITLKKCVVVDIGILS
mgnify:CR=1 FL=1